MIDVTTLTVLAVLSPVVVAMIFLSFSDDEKNKKIILVFFLFLVSMVGSISGFKVGMTKAAGTPAEFNQLSRGTYSAGAKLSSDLSWVWVKKIKDGEARIFSGLPKELKSGMKFILIPGKKIIIIEKEVKLKN